MIQESGFKSFDKNFMLEQSKYKSYFMNIHEFIQDMRIILDNYDKTCNTIYAK